MTQVDGSTVHVADDGDEQYMCNTSSHHYYPQKYDEIIFYSMSGEIFQFNTNISPLNDKMSEQDKDEPRVITRILMLILYVNKRWEPSCSLHHVYPPLETINSRLRILYCPWRRGPVFCRTLIETYLLHIHYYSSTYYYYINQQLLLTYWTIAILLMIYLRVSTFPRYSFNHRPVSLSLISYRGSYWGRK